MAKSRVINTKFWDDNYTANLDPIEKLLFLYMLTNTSTSICGVYEIPLRKIASETGIDKEMIQKILDRFERDQKIFYLEGWIVIKNFIKHQNIRNSKILKGIEVELEKIPQGVVEIISEDIGVLGVKPQWHNLYRTKMSHGKRERILTRDGNQCVNCGSNKDLELDHIIPYSKGGSGDDSNLQTLCKNCNLSKGNKTYISHDESSHLNLNSNLNSNLIKSNLNLSAAAEPTAGVPDIIKLFKESLSPSLSYGNKTQRKAASEMVEKYGLEKTLEMCKVVISIQGKPYAPRASTPYAMWTKIGDFKSYFEVERNKDKLLGKDYDSPG